METTHWKKTAPEELDFWRLSEMFSGVDADVVYLLQLGVFWHTTRLPTKVSCKSFNKIKRFTYAGMFIYYSGILEKNHETVNADIAWLSYYCWMIYGFIASSDQDTEITLQTSSGCVGEKFIIKTQNVWVS